MSGEQKQGEAPYAVGDLVRLKSGGPVMTVSELKGDGFVRCLWFAGGELLNGAIASALLEPASGPDPD